MYVHIAQSVLAEPVPLLTVRNNPELSDPRRREVQHVTRLRAGDKVLLELITVKFERTIKLYAESIIAGLIGFC